MKFFSATVLALASASTVSASGFDHLERLLQDKTIPKSERKLGVDSVDECAGTSSEGLRDLADIVDDFCSTGVLDIYEGMPGAPPATPGMGGKKGGMSMPSAPSCDCGPTLYAIPISEVGDCVSAPFRDDFRYGEFKQCTGSIVDPCGNTPLDTGAYTSILASQIVDNCCVDGGRDENCEVTGSFQENSIVTFFDLDSIQPVQLNVNTQSVYPPKVLGSFQTASVMGTGLASSISGNEFFLGTYCTGQDGRRRELRKGGPKGRKLDSNSGQDDCFELYLQYVCEGEFSLCGLSTEEFARLNLPLCSSPFDDFLDCDDV